MTVRPILRYPDPRLRMATEPVTNFDAALRSLADDLLDTMHAAPGVGIAAPHIGILQRVAVIEVSATERAQVYVNPAIVWRSLEKIRHSEGSISMPGAIEEVERHARIRVEFQDLDGAVHPAEAEGLLAVCLQHEIDQLGGLFWLRRLSALRRDRLVRRYDKEERRR